MASYITNLKRTWKKLLLATHAVLPGKTWLVSVSYPPGILTRELGRCLLLPLEVLVLLAVSLLEPSLTRSRQPYGSCYFRWLLISGQITSLSQERLMLTCPPLLCVTQILLCSLWTLPSQAAKRELTQWVWGGGCWPRKFCTHTCVTISKVTSVGGHTASLVLQRPWRHWKRRASRCWKGCDQGGIVQGEWTVPAPELTATQLRLQRRLEMQVSWGLVSGLSRRWGHSAHHWRLVCTPTVQATEWVGTSLSGLKLFVHTFKQKMQIRLTENVSLKKRKRKPCTWRKNTPGLSVSSHSWTELQCSFVSIDFYITLKSEVLTEAATSSLMYHLMPRFWFLIPITKKGNWSVLEKILFYSRTERFLNGQKTFHYCQK